jgi:MscS family membrane protein
MSDMEWVFEHQYFKIVYVAIGLYLLKYLTNRIIFKYLEKLFARTETTVDEKILAAIKSPLNFLFIILFLLFTKNILELSGDFDIIIKTLFAFLIFWTIHQLIDPFSEAIDEFSAKFGKEVSKGITNFILKTLKVLNFMIGFAVILQSWGYNVTGFVASLGIGGLAFALAAKDTAANLFGSLVIFGDKPFQIGDWIKTDEVEGTVEDIGIRSTKVRTFAQALVHVPNATLANSAIINWSRMGKRRIKMNIGLTYETTEAQMRTILEQVREMLSRHEDIHNDTIYIYFTDYSESSLDIFCYFFTKTTIWGEYMRVREDVNLRIKKIVEENGSAFAFPSRTVYIEGNE